MRFISPKTDFAFKKIFGSKNSEPILRSFLNAILYGGQPTIVSLDILDPYSVPRLEGMKDTYLDVRAQLDSGETVLIEMQVLNIEGFEKRVLYNAAKEYANQLQKAADYDTLRPVIALTITDFVMFAEEELADRIINRFALIEKEQFIHYPDGDVELVFVELPKFGMEVDALQTATEKWLYFLKQAGSLEVAPDTLTEIPEIERAFSMAEHAKLSRDEERALDKKLQWLADQRSLKKTNRKLAAELEARQSELDRSRDELEKAKALLREAGLTEEQIDEKLG